MLTLDNWSKSYGDHLVLDEIHLHAGEGEVLAIIGSSGAGKSTLLRSINFLEPADSGEITLGDLHYDVKKMSKTDILTLRRKTAMVFQHHALFGRKTARENVMEALLLVKRLSQREAEERAEHYLEKVGMVHERNSYPKHLSGGEKQRVGIARALAIEPAVLLLDEPTSALDPEMVKGILDLISEIRDESMTMILVTHEMNFAKEVATNVIFLEKGRILEAGAPSEIFLTPSHPRTEEFIHGFYK